MTISKERALEKIRKCLALSESNEPHEAARALSQARALMAQFNINDDDLSPAWETADIATANKNHPTAAVMLANVVGTAFAAFVSFRPYKISFTAHPPAHEISAFCADFLFRQHSEAVSRYSERISGIALAKKRRRAESFAEGWVIGVYYEVRKFATPLSDADSNAARRFVERHNNATVIPRLALTDDSQADSAIDFGFSDGRKIRINHPIEDVVTTREAAAMCGVSVRTIYTWRNREHDPFPEPIRLNPGRERHFKRSAVTTWLHRNYAGASQATEAGIHE